MSNKCAMRNLFIVQLSTKELDDACGYFGSNTILALRNLMFRCRTGYRSASLPIVPKKNRAKAVFCHRWGSANQPQISSSGFQTPQHTACRAAFQCRQNSGEGTRRQANVQRQNQMNFQQLKRKHTVALLLAVCPSRRANVLPPLQLLLLT